MLFSLLATALAGPTLRFPGPLEAITHKRPPPIRVADLPRVEKPSRDPQPEERPETPAEERPPPEPVATLPTAPSTRPSKTGRAVAKSARKHLTTYPSGYRNDCSGFAMAALAVNGITVSGSTRHMWERAEREGLVHRSTPAPGDLAFFDDTYDRNRNGRRDDDLTHVAVVVEVTDDGNVLLAHAGTSKGRTWLHMNVDKPRIVTADGVRYNDYLRGRRKGESRELKFLAGELFRGYARFTE